MPSVIEADCVEVVHVWGKRMLHPSGTHHFKSVQTQKTRVLGEIPQAVRHATRYQARSELLDTRIHSSPDLARSSTGFLVRGMTASVLDALATITLPFSLLTITPASTKTRFFPVRKTSARQMRFRLDAGRRNETLFSIVITSRPSGTVDAAAPPHASSARVISTPAGQTCVVAGKTEIR